MQAVTYTGPREFSITDTPGRPLRPAELRLRVLASGVCGTDAHIHEGEFGVRFPVTPGHEMVGEIAEVASFDSGFSVGDRVVVDNALSCGRCRRCASGSPGMCLNFEALGLTLDGSVAEYVIAPAHKCVPIGDLDIETAVLAEPTACVVHGLDVLQVTTADDVLIIGAGPTGQILAQMISRGGAGRVTIAAPTQFKLDVAARNGVDLTLLTDRRDFKASLPGLRKIAPHGFDIVVDATGAASVLQHALSLVKDRGTLLVYGMAAEQAEISIRPYDIFRRELTIKGAFAQMGCVPRAVALLASGKISSKGLITHRFGLEEYQSALDALADPDCLKAIIVPATATSMRSFVDEG